MSDRVRDIIDRWRLDANGGGSINRLSRAPQRVRALTDAVAILLEDASDDAIDKVEERLDDPDCEH